MSLSKFTLTDVALFGGLLLLCTLGGFMAQAAGMPMPFMTGGLFMSAAFAILVAGPRGIEIPFPQPIRRACIAAIGVMIGSSFSPDVAGNAASYAISLTVLVLFLLLILALGYWMFRTLLGFDRPTALFSAMPGGLIDSVVLGEQAGGNVPTLTMVHFARVILVMVSVPLIFLFLTGEAVGSSAGQTLEQGGYDWSDLLWIVCVAVVGVWIGQALRLPASHMMGPLVLSAILHGFGYMDIHTPSWALNSAQIVVGAGLGVQFSGATVREFGRAFSAAGLYVFVSLILAYFVVAALQPFVDIPIDALFISFAPGGVTEMSLVALSLGASPVVVAAHHLFRIFITITGAGVAAKLFFGVTKKKA